MPVDALLEGLEVHQILDAVIARLRDHPIDLDRPRRDLHRAGVLGRVALLEAELVEIVVGGDVLVGVHLVGGDKLGIAFRDEGVLRTQIRRRLARGQRRTGRQPDRASCRRPNELAARPVDRLRRDFREWEIARLLALDDHDAPRTATPSDDSNAPTPADRSSATPIVAPAPMA